MHSREDAVQKGIPLAECSNKMLQRAPWHDYREPGLYMLTLTTLERRPLLGKLCIQPYPYIDLTPLGRIILDAEICKIPMVHPNVKVWKACIMPDHIHIIVEVCKAFSGKKHLGEVVRGFKTGCNKAYRHLYHIKEGTMFGKKYHDRILLPGMQCEKWKRYMDENPRRLAIKRMHPELFTTIYSKVTGGRECQIYGNLFLLDIPDKCAVIVHRRDTDEEHARNREQWMACGERGGVIVTAAIAPREKEIFDEALSRGYSIIMLCDNGFAPHYKPYGKLFDSCAQGKLLQISPWEYKAQHIKISRAQCLELNALAASIAGASSD